MIGKLKGVVDEIAEDHAVIDVGGVGYVAFCSARTLGQMVAGAPATLLIETYVREDMIRLFGFATHTERDWFRLLQSVQGVGAKVALALLSTLTASELANAIALRDIAMVARAPGIGKKVAERIVTELKDKTPGGGPLPGLDSGIAGVAHANAPSAVTDAISALANLGYSRDVAAQAVAAALKQGGESASSATLIRLGLKELAK
ncbi:MAG: Holliday junction branch migration protein RuvA [Phyllobacteriaceae bacterium]|nr:Holliday junction branch migration protein RuvA [Phyllobacteriaceae bacterium]